MNVEPAIDPAGVLRSSVASRPRVELMRALRAFARLRENKEDTRQVFEIVGALSGGSLLKAYRQMLQSEEGARQAYRRLELAQYFDDPAWLAQFPAGSVGDAYRTFTSERNLSVSGLARHAHDVSGQIDAEHPIAWYARRGRDLHDAWHTLTGYGTDVLGEACILGFTHAQNPNPGVIAIAVGAALEFSLRNPGPPYLRAVLEGYRIGSRAARLIDEDYFTMFAEPLASARRRLRLERPELYLSIPYAARETLIATPLGRRAA